MLPLRVRDVCVCVCVCAHVLCVVGRIIIRPYGVLPQGIIAALAGELAGVGVYL
ncbi:MAG: hypothetical protein LBF67_02605 [Prevotellaceae bacterium]|nr:hypothetical protein [Prevotellaceae bacterium]